MSFMQWEAPKEEPEKETSNRQEYMTRLIIDVPSCLQVSTDVNVWECVRHINLRYGEKNYILAFCACLQLTKQQQHYLLLIYAEKYQEAYDKEKEINRRESSGKYHANTWLRKGARGFIQRMIAID